MFGKYRTHMTRWNIYRFEAGEQGIVRRLVGRGLMASSEASAIDIMCKHLQGVPRGSLFAREARSDDWCKAQNV